MVGQVSVPVEESSQIGEVRRMAVALAEALPLSSTRRGNAAIVATELATNLVRHARQGRVLLQTLRIGEDVCLELLAVDNGPGLDLQRCLQDGYSTGSTPGNGLGAVRRLSDEFDAYATDKGTVVMSRFRVDPSVDSGVDSRIAPGGFRVGAVSLAAPGETICGDGWQIAVDAGAMALMVADGLGHGPLAGEASGRAAAAFRERPFASSEVFFEHAHRALGGSRGAAVARAVVTADGPVHYAGIGNISGTLVGVDGSRGLATQNGIVGVEVRRQPPVTNTYPWPDHGVLLMHSDGVGTRWTLADYPGLLVRHPALVAAVLCRDYIRGRDDATMVVVSRHREGRGQ